MLDRDSLIWIRNTEITHFKFIRKYQLTGNAVIKSEFSFLKGSREPESRGVWNMSNCPNLARTAAIEVRFSLNFAVVFDFPYFRFRASKAKLIGIVLPNWRNAASFFPPL
jgi:hypothetical protein